MRCMLFLIVAVGCSARREPAPASSVPFAAAYLERGRAAEPAPPGAAEPQPVGGERSPRTADDEFRGLVTVSPDRLAPLRSAAASDAGLTARLARPLAREEFEALAAIRSPAVRAARDRLAAVRTGYAQSADLADLVALYRSFARETRTRVGPERSRKATSMLAPYPNVEALSGELIARAEAIAFEQLRLAIRDEVARAERAYADAVHLAGARQVLTEDIRLHEALVATVRAKLEAGNATQAALLSFRSRLASIRTELAVLGDREESIRAEWNAILARAPDAALHLPAEPGPLSPAGELPAAAAVVERALTEREELRKARLVVERQEVAVRLAETMNLDRFDLGASRFERERAGEAGVQRGAVFPAPGRPMPPRAEFGVREAQLAEMRDRLAAARADQSAMRDATRSGAADARATLASAQRRWRVRNDETVPLAERAFESTRGSYEGNRADYIELLDRARALLEARLGRVDARRAFDHAHAALLRAVGVRMMPGEKETR